MTTTNKQISTSIAFGGLVAAGALAAAFLIQRRKQVFASADNLIQACEHALQKLSDSDEVVAA